MTDLTTLTDDQIRVKAAEACGYITRLRHPEDTIPHHYHPDHPDASIWFDPLHDLNDAVALAEVWQERDGILWWKIESPSCRSHPRWFARLMEGSVSVGHEYANSPARALTMAVLTAADSQEPPDA